MYVLHYWPDSASLIVHLVLAELGVPFRLEKVDRANGALDGPAYRALHPLGKIPVLETPDGSMFETAAILLYLSERHPGLAPLPGGPDRAGFLTWMLFATNHVHMPAMAFFYPDRVAGPDHSAVVMENARPAMTQSLGVLEAMAARAPAWLPPDRPSALGYYIGVVLRWLSQNGPGHPGYFTAADFPALHQTLAMLEARPSALAVAKAEALGPTIFTNPQS
jgi:glutathione S-transferase